MRTINKIILHCSATEAGKPFTAADIRKWHKTRGFADIGYHFIVDLDGTIEPGRPVEQVGAHCTGHNMDSIGICYVGGLVDGKPKDTRTEAQKEALQSLVKQLREQYGSMKVYGHNFFANKACPCISQKQIDKEYNSGK